MGKKKKKLSAKATINNHVLSITHKSKRGFKIKIDKNKYSNRFEYWRDNLNSIFPALTKLQKDEYYVYIKKYPTPMKKKDFVKNRRKIIHKSIEEYHELTLEQYRKIMAKPCERCNSHGKKHLHHKIYLSQGGTNTPNNREVLCKKCHEIEHGRKLNF